jgi:glutaredoxin
MLSDSELSLIADNQYVIFGKTNCVFCDASKKLMEVLVDKGVVPNYVELIIDKDFTNNQLTSLVKLHGWIPEGEQDFCSKPQIFMKGEYIGGNFEFYNSDWNKGKNSPNLKNQMRF